jgi:hypothetical protein
MFDITTQAVADTATLHVKNAAGEPLYADDARGQPVRIVIFGPGSKAHGTVESRQSTRALKRMTDNDGRITAPTAEERISETAEDLAALTVAFENFEYPPAGKAKGTELFEAVYRDQKLGFITRQVAKHIADWANFKPGSAAS